METNKMIKTLRIALTASVFAFSAIAAQADGHSNPEVGGAAMMMEMNIVENAMNSADHTTLVAAVAAAGLVDTLKSEGPFTVFAPVNAAFAALPEGAVDTLLKPESKDTLVKVLTAHVVAGTVLAADLVKQIGMADGGKLEIQTVSGDTLTAMLDDGMVKLMDESGNIGTVTIADVKQSNGVIHVVDTVLLPK
jgi:uncharacterized surface protein with fasciclin (FAS1) repeats